MPSGLLNLNPLPPRKTRQSADYQVGLYVRNMVVTRTTYESGKLVVPVAGQSGTPCEVVQVSAPHGGRLVTFDIAKFGLQPLVPGIESSDPNVVHVRSQVEQEEQVAEDGVRRWFHVWGWHLYAFLKSLVPGTDPLPFGCHTTDRTDPADNVLPPEAFVDVRAPLLGKMAPGDDPNRLRKLIQKGPKP